MTGKRTALDREEAKKAKTVPKPSYVVTLPFVVNPSDDSCNDTSSGESDRGEFPPNALKAPEKYFRFRSNYRGSVLPYDKETEGFGILTKHDSLDNVIRHFDEEAFEDPTESSARMNLSVGLNGMESLSRSRNERIKREFSRPIASHPVACEKFGFFWRPLWEKKVPIARKKSQEQPEQTSRDEDEKKSKWKPVTFQEVRQFYRAVKKKDKKRGVHFRKQAESFDRRSIVPFRELRERIKNHKNTKQLIAGARQKASGGQVYLGISDADIVCLNGAYSHYDRMIQENEASGIALEVASVGYRINPTSDKEHILSFGVLLDLHIRHVTAKFFPAGVYYPEPSTIVRVLPGEETISESFVTKPNYQTPDEVPTLIDAVRQKRQIDVGSQMKFDARGAISTQIPERMERSDIHAWRSRKNKKIVRWNLRELKSIRKLNQSHYNSRQWAMMLLRGLPKPKHAKLNFKQSREVLISLLSRLFNAYDPVSIAEQRMIVSGSLCFQKILIDVLHEDQFTPTVRSVVNRNNESTNFKPYDSINKLRALKAALREFFADDIVEKLHKTARLIRRRLIRLYKNRLSLDFAELSEALMQDVLGVKELGECGEIIDDILNNRVFSKPNSLKKEFLSKIKHKKPLIHKTTLMHWAAITGNTQLVKRLLKMKKYKNDIQHPAHNNIYPLTCALYYCLDNGIDAELIDLLSNQTVFDEAIISGQSVFFFVLTHFENPVPIFKEWLKKNLISVSDDVLTDLNDFYQHCEKRSDNLMFDILNYFEDKKAWNQRYDIIAFILNHINSVEDLMPEDLKSSEATEISPLNKAIAQGDIKMVKLLVKVGLAELDKYTDPHEHVWIETPSILYAWFETNNPMPMIQCLYDLGADINKGDDAGHYLIHEALYGYYDHDWCDDFVKWLIHLDDIDFDQTDGFGFVASDILDKLKKLSQDQFIDQVETRKHNREIYREALVYTGECEDPWMRISIQTYLDDEGYRDLEHDIGDKYSETDDSDESDSSSSDSHSSSYNDGSDSEECGDDDSEVEVSDEADSDDDASEVEVSDEADSDDDASVDSDDDLPSFSLSF